MDSSLLTQRLAPGEQLHQLLHTLHTPVGVGMAAVFLGLVLALIIRPAWRWPVVSVLIYVSALGFFNKPWFQTHFIAPLEILRDHGRSISGALLIVLLIPTLQSHRGWRHRIMLAGTITFFVFELSYITRLLGDGLYSRGLGGLLIYALIFAVFGVGLSRWLQTWDDVYKAVQSMALVGAIFATATTIQLIINRSGIIWQGRLTAIGSTATLCSELIVLALLPTITLIIHPRTPKPLRIVWIAISGLLGIFLLWTGTRTGILMTVVGLSVIFRRRLGTLAWIGPLLVIALMVGLSLLPHSGWAANRLLSTANTRTAVWYRATQHFLEYPIVGRIGAALVIENSYLTTAEDLGLFGLIPLLAGCLFIVVEIVRLQKMRSLFGDEALIADLIAAGLAAIAAGAFFDGYLLGMLNAPVFCIYIYLAMMAFMFDLAKAHGQIPSATPSLSLPQTA